MVWGGLVIKSGGWQLAIDGCWLLLVVSHHVAPEARESVERQRQARPVERDGLDALGPLHLDRQLASLMRPRLVYLETDGETGG